MRGIADQTESLTVNDHIALQDINLPEPTIAPPLQLPTKLNVLVDNITRNVMTRITQETMPKPKTIDVDPAVNQGSDIETFGYIENGWIDDMIPGTTDNLIPQEILDSLARINNTPSPPRHYDELLLITNQTNGREATITNDDKDEEINFTITKTRDGVNNTLSFIYCKHKHRLKNKYLKQEKSFDKLR